MIKQDIHIIKGMQRDLSVSSFNPEYAYENKNIRIMPTDESTLLSIINEKGTKNLSVDMKGVPIGQSIIENSLIVFTTENSKIDIKGVEGDISDINIEEFEIQDLLEFQDRIYKIDIEKDSINKTLLYEGILGFDTDNPIEAVSLYENDLSKKVYWVDGLNQARVLNIQDYNKKIWNDTSFNFIPRLKLNEKVSIIKRETGGTFPSGVIQYVFTYYNKYLQESNIFYTSDLFYSSDINRANSPEESTTNSFEITLNNLDTNFDYVRVYSIFRTSINATPTCKRVIDLKVSSDTINFTDTGNIGNTIDNTELLYIGGEDLVPYTLEYKDDTLFLGNIKIERPSIDNTIKEYFRGKEKSISISMVESNIELPDASGYYSYKSNLDKKSSDIKIFKYLDTYRFGIQFQHYTGRWSEPVFIGDVRITKHIEGDYYKKSTISIPVPKLTIDDVSIIKNLLSKGYIKARPIVVYPTIYDRECICQGILCPTVFNVEDRYSNSPYSQSSWFTRPNAPFDIYKSFNFSTVDGLWRADWRERNSSGKYSINSAAGSWTNTVYNYLEGGEIKELKLNFENYGAWAEFRHFHPIPNNASKNAEIQCISNPPLDLYIDSTGEYSSGGDWANKYKENFYIDQSIVTLHSPDIEFDDSVKSINTSNLKLRIIGIVPITSFYGDIDITTSTPQQVYNGTETLTPGFYKENIGSENISILGYRNILSGAFWMDEFYKSTTPNRNYPIGFVVYPFHRNGSLNNDISRDGSSAKLKYKKLSNLKYSYNSYYFNKEDIWNAYVEDSSQYTGISGVSILNEYDNITKLPSQLEGGKDIVYYNNIDKIIVPSRNNGLNSEGYHIVVSSLYEFDDNNLHNIFTAEYKTIPKELTSVQYGVEPVSMKYKSTPHAVLALKYNKTGDNRVLPTLKDGDYQGEETWNINYVGESIPSNKKLYWEDTKVTNSISQDVLSISFKDKNGTLLGTGPEYGWLWLGELYNDSITEATRFGGKTPEAIENNLWLPCGEAVSINDLSSSISIEWREGDTYYQRYDHIKTYPYTLEDQNAITDIVSFMCETRVNIDGRYDRNRGQLSNFSTTPENFNKINPVYSQSNNYFNYRLLDESVYKQNYFPNTVTWSKSKLLGDKVDTWTNMNFSSVLDLDGNKGKITSIKRYNNTLIAFQEKGISTILYNDRVQIPTNDGVPIEISNSGKVNGKVYLSNTIGCSNKWSIVQGEKGLYFIDSIGKGIYLLNNQITNISDKYGFHSWINQKIEGVSIWNPKDFNSFVSYYDKTNGDILFIDKNDCLTFSEPLDGFTSFYSYNNTPYMANVNGRNIAINKSYKGGTKYNLWELNEGEYNMFYDKYFPFYTTVISNTDRTIDKIFNTLEFRADSWNKDKLLNTTFDTLTTWNEYQYGESKLTNILGKPSPLKRKFRIWRANIPRDKYNGRDRMRNPWLYVKLSMEKENTNKTILHDLVVHYFI